MTLIDSLRGGLLVSCQSSKGNPLVGPEVMALLARAAEAGGAIGFRAEGAADIAAIRAVTALPIIGIFKAGPLVDAEVFITPSFSHAAAMAAAGADIIALDGTARPRPTGETLKEIIGRIHDELGLMVMADVDNFESGQYAERAGADLVGTTLSGYTAGSVRDVPDVPDVALVAALVEQLSAPVVAEGRYWTREDVAAAFTAGAHCVVVGSAITNPMLTTRRMVAVTPPRS